MYIRRQRKKGQVEFNVAFLGVEIVILIIMIFTLNKVISNFIQPHFQIAYANAELLRSTIDGLCERGSGTATLANWEFPQPLPLKATFAGFDAGKNIIPKFMIKSRGDPHFLLYYEAFPAPWAFGWEVYQSTGDRLIMPIARESDIQNANRTVNNEILAPAKSATGIRDIVIPNIILGNKGDDGFAGSDGEWNQDFYSIKGYDLLPEAEKSLIKYRACGNYALCMKTSDGIIRLPLPNCKKRGIDYMQIGRAWSDVFEAEVTNTLGLPPNLDFSDPDFIAKWSSALIVLAKQAGPKLLAKTLGRAIPVIGWAVFIAEIISTGVNMVSDIISGALSTADFHIASPCKTNLEISVGTCSCSALQERKMFQYDRATDTLGVVGDYKTCWDQAEGATGSGTSIPCISVSWYDKTGGFCNLYNTVLPSQGFTRVTKLGSQYESVFQSMKLKQSDELKPGFVDYTSGWVWPGE